MYVCYYFNYIAAGFVPVSLFYLSGYFFVIMTSRVMIIPELDCKDFHYIENNFLHSFMCSMCFHFVRKQDFEHNRRNCSVGDHIVSS